MKNILFILVLFFSGCQITDDISGNSLANLSLLLAGSSSTEIWIKASKGNLKGNVSLRIIDNVTRSSSAFTLYSPDTIVYRDKLSPSRDYSYSLQRVENGKVEEETMPLAARTDDTTSHNFTLMTPLLTILWR